MRKIFTLTGLFITLHLSAQNVESYINNYSFEFTNWQDVSWFSQTNTGNPIIVNQTQPFFEKNHITAYSGFHFAYIGGYQSTSGFYEAQLAQEFNVPHAGNATLEFQMRTINLSTDPGSVIKIIIDGNAVWNIQPYYLINTPLGYDKITVSLGYMDAGNHTIELVANENPLGGNNPMQFAFDEFVLQSVATASTNNELPMELNVVSQHGLVYIQSNQELNAEAKIQMMDLSGKIVYSNSVFFGNQFIIPTQELSNGIYIVNMMYGAEQISKKIYISK